MKVYILLGCFEWEDSTILGVYKTKQKAKRELKKWEREHMYDFCIINDAEVK